MRFLDPVALAKIGTLKRKARTIVEGALSGLHRSRHHGSSVEFAEHKEYAPGDNIRHIDWKAFGKLDRYYVKRFEEETEASAYLVLDRSGSMDYRGDGISKLEYAAFLAAALCYLFIRQQDKVGLYGFGGSAPPVYVPPRSRSSHLHDLLRAIENNVEATSPGPTDLIGALDRVAELSCRRRSVVCVLSDFFEPSPEVARVLKRLRARRHDVSVFHVLDPHEMELPFDQLMMFESLESDDRILADPVTIRRAYKKELDEFLQRTRRVCAESDIEYQQVLTDHPLERTLLNYLLARLMARPPHKKRLAVSA